MKQDVDNVSPTEYLSGFGNEFCSEAVAGALPQGQNSPQKCPYGLYAEQISGSAFTRPRSLNQRTWMYRILPSAQHPPFLPLKSTLFACPKATTAEFTPNQMRWNALSLPSAPHSFISGLQTWANNPGAAIHLFTANTSMVNEAFYNADGEMLIVLQDGNITAVTEMGALKAGAGEIIVIPRGVKFAVTLDSATIRGYILENFHEPLRLPDLGPIGANCLANPRDFLYPVASFFDEAREHRLIAKYNHKLWQTTITYNPFDVVAWHGNYLPYKYDLEKFCAINTVSYDHPDPSIFTVLTSPSTLPGIANVDFVIFPRRWMVAEDTFRPPYFHRNVMSEFMGLIRGVYDGKEQGFEPGGASLHNCMSAHGPDSGITDKATNCELKPQYYGNVLAFMFESSATWNITPRAVNASELQKEYYKCWDFKRNFVPPANSE